MIFEIYDIGDAYAMFAIISSLLCLWAMQKVTHDANVKTWLGKIKWMHRASIGMASVAFMMSAAYTLYFSIDPRPVDFVLIFVLLLVLILSVMRHIQAPVRRVVIEEENGNYLPTR